jgi:hypothetical protein
VTYRAHRIHLQAHQVKNGIMSFLYYADLGKKKSFRDYRVLMIFDSQVDTFPIDVANN